MNKSQALLVVEDIPNILEMLELTLRFKGYEVITARNGQEALEVLKERRPALIITDILMPKMDGFSLMYHLRTDRKTRDIPVVFVSATYVAPEDKAFAKTLGATKFIEKPIDMEELLKTISQLLKQGSAVQTKPIREREFFEKYLERLEIKLDQKKTQIARTQRLLETISANEKPGFEASLKQAINDRRDIEAELEQVREHLQASNSQK
ncbi:MAG: response regulator [Chloroflexi bacterium]|nr:response regulator [Chloroflexota bacterium]